MGFLAITSGNDLFDIFDYPNLYGLSAYEFDQDDGDDLGGV